MNTGLQRNVVRRGVFDNWQDVLSVNRDSRFYQLLEGGESKRSNGERQEGALAEH